MKKNILLKFLLVGVVTSVSAFAEMTVDTSNAILTISSEQSGTVTAKVIGPNDEVIVDETYEGTSFSWTPSGSDGAYRYEVRVDGEYAGGSVEVKDGQLVTEENTEENDNEK